MSTQISLTVVKSDCPPNQPTCNGNNSTTTITADSLEDLARMLQLAGIKAPAGGAVVGAQPAVVDTTPSVEPAPVEEPVSDVIADESTDYDYGNNPTSRKGSEYDVSSDTHRKPQGTHYVPARSGDNPLDESDDRALADTYHGHRASVDHGEAVARTADEHGVPGEHVEKAVRNHKAYESIAKGFMDYLREVQAGGTVDEAYGARTNRRTGHTTYAQNSVALLPITGAGSMVNLDGLGDNEYARMNQPNEGIVVFAIEVGDGKQRLTYASSAGNVESRYKPGTQVLTYHDQSGKERPGKVLFAFDSSRYQTPEGRKQIEDQLRQHGMDPKKKYSLRVFK